MPDLGRLPVKQRATLEAQAVAEHDSTPVSRPARALSLSRVAVVTSAGLHLRADRPFRREDPGYRVLPSSSESSEIVQSHSSIGFDRTATQRDINVVYPVDRLREYVAEGVVGELAPRFVSFMGAQRDPVTSLSRSAQEVAGLLLADAVDVVVLTPT